MALIAFKIWARPHPIAIRPPPSLLLAVAKLQHKVANLEMTVRANTGHATCGAVGGLKRARLLFATRQLDAR
jgi:hypothetical protein